MKAIIYINLAITLVITPVFLANEGSTFSCAEVTEIPQPECEALVALYYSTNGLYWHNRTNWLENNSPGTWWGVNVYYGHVEALQLYNNLLEGTLPAEIGHLPFLHVMDLSNNRLQGAIPGTIGNLSALGGLYLQNNQLSSSIPPEIGHLSSLNQLLLSNNRLTGSIPPEMGQLSNLSEMDLSHNQLSGEIPDELANITGLWQLTLSYNQLTGSVPAGFSDHPQLWNCYLDHNQLSGTLPTNLGMIVRLDLSWNQFSGSIPPEIYQLNEISWLYISHNQLTGEIPPELGNLVWLYELTLDSNQLSGSIPTEIGNLTLLEILNLSDNRLSGDIPVNISYLWNLFEYDGYYSFIYGLDLSYNMLNVPPGYPVPGDLLQLFLHQKDPDWQLYQGFSQVIGFPGGELTSLDGRADFLIPAGAVTIDTTFSFIPHPMPINQSSGLVPANNNFEFNAADSSGNPITAFNLPITVTLTYTDADYGVLSEDELGLFYWGGEQNAWTNAVSTCPGDYSRNLENNILALPLCHLTEFGLFGEPLQLFLPVIRR